MNENPNTGLVTRKTPAQRQAARRHKLLGQCNQRRLNLWIDASAFNALRRMAQRDAVTQSQILESLLRDAEDRIVATLELDSTEWETYFRLPSAASNRPIPPRTKETPTT